MAAYFESMTWGGLQRSFGRRWVAFVDAWLMFAGRRMSLAFKLVVPIMVATSVIAAVAGTGVNGLIRGQIEGAYAQEGRSVAAGVEAIYVVHPNDLTEIDTYLTRLVAERPDILFVRIHRLDAAATVLASSRPAEVGRGGLADGAELQAILAGRFLQDEDDGNVLNTVAPLEDGGRILAAVMISTSKSAQVAATNAVAIGIIIAAVGSVLMEPVFVLSVLYFGIIRRTRRMQRAVEALAAGDTSVRLAEGAEPPGRDEIFNLSRSVDHMIRRLDERHRGEMLVRRLSQLAMSGTPPSELIANGMSAARDALNLETCIFATVGEDGRMDRWRDGSAEDGPATALPVWVFALTRVAIEARRAVVSDRLGRGSRFAEDPGVASNAQVAIVPLPRTSKAGHAIVAIAAAGQTVPEGGLAVLDSVAATIADSLHMQAAENARAESAVKSRVMASVSHEMRNPLNSILGFTGLVLRSPDGQLTDKQRRQLGYVQSSANNMLTLVNNYLDLARVRSGSLALQYETVKIAVVVDEVAGATRAAAVEKNVILLTSVTDGLEARTDPTRLRQVLANLVSNAVKFTGPGGRVVLRARALRGELHIAVSDDGVGVPRDQVGMIFSEFAKIDAGRLASAKGSGLGLALTQAFVVAMGGTITVYTRPGSGSTFVVRLPLEAGAAKAAA